MFTLGEVELCRVMTGMDEEHELIVYFGLDIVVVFWASFLIIDWGACRLWSLYVDMG